MGKILLYYKYVNVENPEAIVKWQKRLCKKLGLTGRIIIAQEGINGTVGGSDQATAEYTKIMEEHPLFSGIDYKEAPGDERYFPRIRVQLRKEIVNLGIDPDQLTTADGGTHLTPEEAHKLMTNRPDNFVIIDTRNDYETRIGTFPGSMRPDKKYFREFPEYIDKHTDELKDKTVLMACTGGIRCERASAYVNKKGVTKKVYQIEGGIHRYIEKFPDGHFRGSNYVFDGRISHRVNDDILTTCDTCPTPADYYTNCVNARCNKQFIGCPSCITKNKECCSVNCMQLVESGKVNTRKKLARVVAQLNQQN
jgi:predicted sulfurtransferase